MAERSMQSTVTSYMCCSEGSRSKLSTQRSTMPRPKKLRQYDKDQLVAAVQSVKKGRMSITEAATHYNVPRTTLSDHVHGKISDFKTSGPSRELDDELEDAVVGYLMYMSRQNFPLRRTDTRTLIVDLIRRRGPEAILKCRFNLEKGPSDNWFRRFEERHQELKWTVPQTMDKWRIHQSDEMIIDRFFNLYECELKKLNVMDKPHCIFNCDESGVNSRIATREKAYGVRGETSYQEKVSSIDHITVMMCVNASGRVLPSYLIFEKNIPKMGADVNLPEKWMMAASPNGYMDKELFQDWFEKVFLPNCGRERPVILLLDNHDSHLSSKVIDLAREKQITMIGFPAHTTHLLQPLDVGVFGDVKKKYNAICIAAGARSSRSRVTKELFPITWSNAVRQAATVSRIRNAFSRSGVFPFDPCAVDGTKLRRRKPTNAVGNDGAAAVVSITKVADINSKITPVEPETEPCTTCNRYPHPVGAVNKLDPKLQLSFPLRCTSTTTNATRKSTRIVTYGRTITSEEILQQIKEKESNKKIPKDHTATSKKRKAENDNEKITTEVSLTTRKSARILQKDQPKKVNTTVEENDDIQHIHIDESLCYDCMKEIPPNLYKNKGCKGKGKSKKQPKKDIDWVFCDNCQKWYHCLCEGVRLSDLGETYKCSVCTNK